MLVGVGEKSPQYFFRCHGDELFDPASEFNAKGGARNDIFDAKFDENMNPVNTVKYKATEDRGTKINLQKEVSIHDIDK